MEVEIINLTMKLKNTNSIRENDKLLAAKMYD